jgi:hypothetical protein
MSCKFQLQKDVSFNTKENLFFYSIKLSNFLELRYKMLRCSMCQIFGLKSLSLRSIITSNSAVRFCFAFLKTHWVVK